MCLAEALACKPEQLLRACSLPPIQINEFWSHLVKKQQEGTFLNATLYYNPLLHIVPEEV